MFKVDYDGRLKFFLKEILGRLWEGSGKALGRLWEGPPPDQCPEKVLRLTRSD
jgi:hypothetical protein